MDALYAGAIMKKFTSIKKRLSILLCCSNLLQSIGTDSYALYLRLLSGKSRSVEHHTGSCTSSLSIFLKYPDRSLVVQSVKAADKVYKFRNSLYIGRLKLWNCLMDNLSIYAKNRSLDEIKCKKKWHTIAWEYLMNSMCKYIKSTPLDHTDINTYREKCYAIDLEQRFSEIEIS